MKQVLFTSLKLSKTEASEILILGESGVGKGLLAKFIHKNSERRKESFIQINCAALPESLLEAELFGYEKGAYTGARNRGKTGLIEIAQNGTLFLDEIGEMPLPLQAKLLTYLDDYLIRPLGSIREKKVPCSVIAATNKDLSDLVKQGRFRDDLFFRINTFTLKIPPLRKRPEDIFGLANLFLQKFNDQYGQNRNISSKFLKILRSYDFPGNVRELESLIKQAVVMSEDEELDDFILTNFGNNCNGPNDRPNPDWGLTQQVKNFEKKLLQEALTHNKTTRKIAASLGISQSAVVKKLKKHGLSRPLIP